ncbi:ribonuclease Z [Candidatus Pacearchaeota archaeon]|nr:ribonuclease Z [Candidatus Pacearchaeota archaeon]
MNLEIVFLGTGSAIPSIKKNHSGFLIKTEREKILIDCGEGVQRQFRKAKENFSKITKILITHWHEDHTLGLAGLLKTMGMNNYSQTLKIYGPRHTKEKIELFQRIYSRYKIRLEINEINNSIVYEDKQIKIESSQMDHGIPTLAYSIIIKDQTRIDKAKLKKLKIPNSPLIGELQKGKDITFNGKKIKSKSVTYTQLGKKVTIILDTAKNQNTIQLAKNSDLLICESTYSADESEQAKEYKHLTTSQAAEIAKKAKVKQLALVHISDKHLHRLPQLLKEAKKVFKNTLIPEDLEVLKV